MRFHLLVLSLMGVTLGLSAAQVRTHITTGGTLPTNCTVGDVWYKTGASAGFYTCSATDTWTAVDSGGTALSGITAATGSNTIASGNNHSQVWNWALTSDSVTAFTFGETTAAINGTSDNQVLIGINALASSTAVPFYIKNYGGADSLRVDDVSGDTTPFIISNAGELGIFGSPTSAVDLTLNFASGGSNLTPLKATDGTRTFVVMTNFDSSTPFGIGSTTNHTLGLITNNVKRAFIDSNGSFRLKNKGSAITLANTGLFISGDAPSLNDYQFIGFGYPNATTAPGGAIGYQTTSTSGNEKGDLVFFTRNVTTDTSPTEQLRILADGTVNVISLKTTGSAGSKNVVCVDTTTGKLYASSTGTDCSN